MLYSINSHRLMLCFCEDRVVCLEVIFLQKFFSIRHLHVKQGVSNAEERVRLGSHRSETVLELECVKIIFDKMLGCLITKNITRGRSKSA